MSTGGAFVYHFTLREDLHYFMRNRACNQYFHSFHSRDFHSQLFQDLFSFLYKPFPIPYFKSYHTDQRITKRLDFFTQNIIFCMTNETPTFSLTVGCFLQFRCELVVFITVACSRPSHVHLLVREMNSERITVCCLVESDDIYPRPRHLPQGNHHRQTSAPQSESGIVLGY